MIYVFLAEGFEEIEAVTPIDLLRRAGKQVVTVGVGGVEIKGRSDIVIKADIEISEVRLNNDIEMLVLPGGLPGVDNLYACDKVKEAVSFCAANEIYIGAICAAPSILGRMGLLKGKTATCYPGFEKHLDGATISSQYVVADGKIITAQGAGSSLEFALKLVEALYDNDASRKLAESLRCNSCND